MSQLLPSFQTIYRQGRFREHHVPESDETTEEGKRLMHQGERFTVACLAFVLHHDISFRADFLRRICGCLLQSPRESATLRRRIGRLMLRQGTTMSARRMGQGVMKMSGRATTEDADAAI